MSRLFLIPGRGVLSVGFPRAGVAEIYAGPSAKVATLELVDGVWRKAHGGDAFTSITAALASMAAMPGDQLPLFD